jgi:hypothetical protein
VCLSIFHLSWCFLFIGGFISDREGDASAAVHAYMQELTERLRRETDPQPVLIACVVRLPSQII